LDRLIQGEGSERDAPMPLSIKKISPLSVKICVLSADFQLPASRLKVVLLPDRVLSYLFVGCIHFNLTETHSPEWI